MASTEDILLTIPDDFLKCKICFNIYEQPKILPCVHTYCSHCLEKLFETSDEPDSILCPECRDSVTLPHKTVSDLKTNFLINSLIEVLKVKTNKDVKCTTCTLRGKISPAKSRCLDCGDYLCPSCSDGHNASSTTWNHKKVLLEDIRRGSYDKELRNIHKLTCSKHKDRQLEYFCEKCQAPICQVCILLLHRDHTCVEVTDAVASQKSRLTSHIKNVKEKLQQLENEKKMACEILACVKKHKAEAIVSTEEQIAGIRAEIEHHKEKALAVVNSIMKCKIEHQEKQVENTNVKIIIARDCLQFCEKLIEQGQDEEMLSLEETITKRLQQVEALSSPEVEALSSPEVEALSSPGVETLSSPEVEELSSPGVEASGGKELPDIDREKAFGVREVEWLPGNEAVSCQFKSKEGVGSLSVSFKLLQSFDTEHEDDEKHPMVRGMTIHNNVIYLSDSANGKIKCISKLGVLKECVAPKGEDSFSPFAVAVCNNVIGAVNENYLYLFDDNGEMITKVVLTAKWTTYHELRFTFALANYQNEGFIVGNLPHGHFRIYTTDGTLLKRFVMLHFYPLANLSVGRNGHFVTCEWGDDSVRVRNTDGKTVTYCQTASSWKAVAAHMNQAGLIFAIDNLQAAVLVFDQNGSLLHKYSTKRDGLFKPVNLAFDDEGLMYLVNTYGNVNVYRINVSSSV